MGVLKLQLIMSNKYVLSQTISTSSILPPPDTKSGDTEAVTACVSNKRTHTVDPHALHSGTTPFDW